MKKLTVIFRAILVTSLCLPLGMPGAATAASVTLTKAPAHDIFITEIQTASVRSSSEEFIELYNDTDKDIELAPSWKLQYFANSKFPGLIGATATEASWNAPTRTIILAGTIRAHDYFVLAYGTYAPGSIQPDQSYSSGLADEGALQLVEASSATSIMYHDRVLWSNDAQLPAGNPLVPAPVHSGSVQRIPNEDEEYINEDGSFTPFAVKPDITPLSPWQAPEVVAEETIPEEPSPAEENSETVVPVPVVAPTSNEGLEPPHITELLPNPASPLTDENDEYIELYNPNDSVFNLKGYTLETGTATLHDFTFTSDTLLEPNSYMAFYASQTNISLGNGGGQARLLDPGAVVLSQAQAYTVADDGKAWALDVSDGAWKWTIVATPGAENVITAPVVVVKTASTTTAKKTTAAKTTTAKVKGTTTVKAKKATAPKKAKSAATKQTAAAATVRPPAPIHAGVLAAVAALAVAYGIYEYRHDLANRIYQFRTNRTARRSARK